MLAMRVSFMNELSRLCHATGADIHTVRAGVASDSRIGKKFLYAGPGYGGSCFPKDVQALMALGREHNVEMRLAEAAHEANRSQATFLASVVAKALGGRLTGSHGSGGIMGRTVALWGLAFKPETDDVREAPSVSFAKALIHEGVRIVGHDPEAGPNFTEVFAGYNEFQPRVVGRDYDALDGVDALVLMTEWRCYLAPDFNEIARRMRGKVVVDARNVWPWVAVTAAGLTYIGLGVPSRSPVGAGV